MNIYVDVDLRQAVVGAGQRSPIGTIEVKNQDTIDFDIYFCQGGSIIDLGSAAALKFGLVAKGQSTLLVLTTAFTYSHDSAGNPYYQGQPVFNTTQMATAMGTSASILCTGEIRFEQPDGEIIHTLTIPFQVDLTLIPETGATPPTVSGSYPDASTLVLLTQADTPGGWLQLDTGGLIPDARMPATVERQSNKNQPGGYPGLTAGKLAGSTLPIDGTTIGLNGSNQLTLLGTLLASLTDFETSAGVSLIHDAAGVLNRLVAGTGLAFDTSTPGEILINFTGGGPSGISALTDAETSSGATLISNANGILKRIQAGANITFDTTSVPGAIIIAASGGTTLTLVDAETSTGKTLLGSTNGQVKRLVAGTNVTLDDTTTPGALILAASGGGGGSLTLVDEETTTGQTLLGATNGMVKRLIAGTNITLDATTTPGALILAASGGGGGGGGASSYNLYQTSVITPTPVGPYAGNQFENGQIVEIATAGTIVSISFYKPSTETGTSHNVHLWTSTGTLIATASTTAETASGWQTATFTTPVGVASGTYMISRGVQSGSTFVSQTLATSISGPLTGLGAASGGAFYIATTGAFPNISAGGNYWIDLNFVPAGAVSVGAAIQAAAAASSTYAAFQAAIAALTF